MRRLNGVRGERGFLVIAAVFLIVVLAALVGYLMTVSTTSQAASAADLNSARASLAARAGAEWGAYQILRNPVGGTFKSTCETGPGFTATKNLTFSSTLSAFTAIVTCTSSGPITEGASTGATAVQAYRLVSNACNDSGGVCPNAANLTSTYVDREVSLSITN